MEGEVQGGEGEWKRKQREKISKRKVLGGRERGRRIDGGRG